MRRCAHALSSLFTSYKLKKKICDPLGVRFTIVWKHDNKLPVLSLRSNERYEDELEWKESKEDHFGGDHS